MLVDLGKNSPEPAFVSGSLLSTDGVKQDEDDELSSPPDLRVEDDSDPVGGEQKQAGGLAWKVYRTYWTSMGGVLASSVLLSLLLMQGQPLN